MQTLGLADHDFLRIDQGPTTTILDGGPQYGLPWTLITWPFPILSYTGYGKLMTYSSGPGKFGEASNPLAQLSLNSVPMGCNMAGLLITDNRKLNGVYNYYAQSQNSNSATYSLLKYFGLQNSFRFPGLYNAIDPGWGNFLSLP
jgi:hypothetical protein